MHTQSSKTPFSLSSKSSHSGSTSVGLTDDFASARDASLPAKTVVLITGAKQDGG